ncbi:MAG: TAXI family TRAP transporter solute-binding subunit, partial [Planctomycetota bacterium]
MSILKGLAAIISAPVRWISGRSRNSQGKEGILYARLIASIALASVVMVVVFAVKLIRVHSPVSITLATAGRGGEYCAFGEALKQVINDNQKRIRVETKPTLGSCRNMQLLEAGEVELAIVQDDTPTKPSVQGVASLFPEMLHLVADQEIKSIGELGGKRIAVMPNLLGEEADPNDHRSFFYRFVERYGIDDELTVSKVLSLEDANDAFLRKEVDAIITFIAVGNECIGRLLRQRNRPARLLAIDANAIRTWYPYVADATIHRAAFWGEPAVPEKNVPSISVQSLLLTHRRVDKRAIRVVTRILYEHRNKLMAKNPRAATMRLASSGQDLGVPLHAGAKAFYHRERPAFIVTYAEPLALFLSIVVLCASGIWHIRLRLQQRQKNRADMYNLEILDLIEQARKIENLHELNEVRQKLFDIFRRVLEDLDEDRISAESFQLFTFPCEVALGGMR